jgi:hypothetical protein
MAFLTVISGITVWCIFFWGKICLRIVAVQEHCSSAWRRHSGTSYGESCRCLHLSERYRSHPDWHPRIHRTSVFCRARIQGRCDHSIEDLSVLTTVSQIVERSKIFLAYISFLILVSLGGSVGRTVALRRQSLIRACRVSSPDLKDSAGHPGTR